MSEEIHNAALNVPRAIFTAVILNGSLGWAMAIATMFCIGDAESVLVRCCHEYTAGSILSQSGLTLSRIHRLGCHTFRYLPMALVLPVPPP